MAKDITASRRQAQSFDETTTARLAGRSRPSAVERGAESGDTTAGDKSCDGRRGAAGDGAREREALLREVRVIKRRRRVDGLCYPWWVSLVQVKGNSAPVKREVPRPQFVRRAAKEGTGGGGGVGDIAALLIARIASVTKRWCRRARFRGVFPHSCL